MRMTDTDRRAHAAYWYAAGWEDAVRVADIPDALQGADIPGRFEEFAKQQAVEYHREDGTRSSLASIPDQFREYLAMQSEASHGS